tara:strand:+ start:434 stop:685 length:252 start_codon:yes stop_codon:yes gene_type:complete
LISRINRNRQQIIRTVVVFMILRAFYGISVMSIAFFLGWDLQNIREFEIFGFRVYLFIIFIVIILIIRRLYRIYGWFRKDTDG